MLLRECRFAGLSLYSLVKGTSAVGSFPQADSEKHMKRQRVGVRRLGDIWSTDSIPYITVCGRTAAACREAGGLFYMSESQWDLGVLLVVEATSAKCNHCVNKWKDERRQKSLLAISETQQ